MLAIVTLASCSTESRSSARNASTAPGGTTSDSSAGDSSAESGSPATGPECHSGASGPETFQPETFRYAKRSGVDANLTSLDLYLPAGCGAVPVVVWVHGGGWRAGDKATEATDRKAAFVNGLGAALVAVNYRLSTPRSGVRWPDHGDDVAAALAWVRNDGVAHGLDPDRLALIGHSAGAHLVSIVVTNPRLLGNVGLQPSFVDCVVSLDIDYDMANSPAEAAGLIAAAFGDDPDVLADASPVVQVERNGAPPGEFLVVSRGSQVRVDRARAFVDVINQRGGKAALLDAGTYTHGEVSAKLGLPGEKVVTPPVADLLGRCLPSGPPS